MPINQYVNQSTNKFANQTTKAKIQRIKTITDFDVTLQNNAKLQCKYPFQAIHSTNTLTNTDNMLTNSEREEIRQDCLQSVVECQLYSIGLLINIQEFINDVNNKAIK